MATKAKRARTARAAVPAADGIGAFRARHLSPDTRTVDTPAGRAAVLVDDSESPLAWLARRRGRDGRPLVAPHQLLAGERLRGDFTRAQLTPRMTSAWATPAGGGTDPGDVHFSDVAVAARQRMHRALDAVGPEFAGLLLDVCCFLKGLEDVERERRWPSRSAKVVLLLALDRLARHYGLNREARGRARAPVRTWLAPDAAFSVE